MGALNFMAYFAPPILAGSKILTMRKPRVDGRDNAPVGKPLSLYTGMRTRGCSKILDTTCVWRCGMQLGPEGPVALMDERGAGGAHAILCNAALKRDEGAVDMLAAADGFSSWAALWAFHSTDGPLDDIGCVYREVIGWEDPR